MSVVRGAIVLGANCLRGNCLERNFPGAIAQGELSCFQFSGSSARKLDLHFDLCVEIVLQKNHCSDELSEYYALNNCADLSLLVDSTDFRPTSHFILKPLMQYKMTGFFMKYKLG